MVEMTDELLVAIDDLYDTDREQYSRAMRIFRPEIMRMLKSYKQLEREMTDD